MDQPYKTKVLKKAVEFDVDGIENCENPIGGKAEMCQNVCSCYRTAGNGAKTSF